MAVEIVRRGTLLIPSGPLEGQGHLFVVVTDPCEKRKCLLLSFSSIKEGVRHDATRLVQVGEHPFITKPSFVEYRHARVAPCDHLIKCIEGWTFLPKEPVSEDLCERMRSGVTESLFTPQFAIEYYLANCGL